MHTLIIKGSDAEAYAACAAHGIDIDCVADIEHRQRFDDTLVLVLDTVPVTALVEWFCEPAGPHPLPAGTLLWYGPAKRSVWNGNLIVPDGTIAPVQDDRFYSRAAGTHIDLGKSVVGEDDQ